MNSHYDQIMEKIKVAASRSERTGEAIRLIAVSKVQSVDKIAELYGLGQRDFGENYVQELLEKAQYFRAQGIQDIRWHFIGHLQRNKVKLLLPVCTAVHSVDSQKLISELAKRVQGERFPIYLSVNIDQEPTKSGFPPDSKVLQRVAQEIPPSLCLQGLMCIPRPSNEGEVRSAFVRLRELDRALGSASQHRLSMGMSQDFEWAIEEGATDIRLGTVLFGARNH